MLQNHVLSLHDYYATVPSLSITDYGSWTLSMRGLTTGSGSGNPTVGITIDDVPFGGTPIARTLGPSFIPQFDAANCSTSNF